MTYEEELVQTFAGLEGRIDFSIEEKGIICLHLQAKFNGVPHHTRIVVPVDQVRNLSDLLNRSLHQFRLQIQKAQIAQAP